MITNKNLQEKVALTVWLANTGLRETYEIIFAVKMNYEMWENMKRWGFAQ